MCKIRLERMLNFLYQAIGLTFMAQTSLKTLIVLLLLFFRATNMESTGRDKVQYGAIFFPIFSKAEFALISQLETHKLNKEKF